MQQVFQQLQTDLDRWRQGAKSLDACFYALTEAFPGHGSRDEIFGKLHFIEKMFQTNASKSRKPAGFADRPGTSVMEQLVDVLEANGAWLDQRLGDLPETNQPAHNEYYAAASVVEDFYHVIYDATGRRLWTFASKYLHCHKPCVPIVDSRARTGIVRVSESLAACGQNELAPQLSENQMARASYRAFVDHVWPVYDFYRKKAPQGGSLTLKQMDFHLYKRGDGQG